MDPAFSLADELAAAGPSTYRHDNEGVYGDEDELQLHPGSSSTLDDEFAQLHQHHHHGASGAFESLDAELEALHLDSYGQHGGHLGNDLASELGGGSLAAELDGKPSIHDHYNASAAMEGGNLANELDLHSSPHRMSRDPSTSSPSRTPQFDSEATSASTTTSLALDKLSATNQKTTEEITQSIAATSLFLSRLSSLSSSSSTAAPHPSRLNGEVGGEDTANLERAAAKYLKLISECTMEREAQVRELRELDRHFARSFTDAGRGGGGWGMTSSTSSSSDLASNYPSYADSSTLPTLDEDPLSPSPTQLRRHQPSHSIASDTTITDTPLTPSSSTTPPFSVLNSTFFTPLHTTTSDLLTSLTSLHEHTQITKSSTADAARKLKSLKTLISQWKAEQESVERSEALIASFEAEAKKANEGKEKRGAKGDWAKEQQTWCKERFEQVEERMRRLLVPVSLAGA